MTSEFDQNYASEQIRRSHNPIRRYVRNFYLDNILRHVKGSTIDFGCGAGQLLAKLPQGSIGIEVNPVLIQELIKKGLNVIHYDASFDDFSLTPFPVGEYHTLVMSHVLEHFSEASTVMRKQMTACKRLSIKRIVFVLPGWKGYLSDSTHKTFIDPAYLRNNGLISLEGYQLTHMHFFPFNIEAIGRFFIFNECVAIYEYQQ
jgi:SAM-dependent methyltransferase